MAVAAALFASPLRLVALYTCGVLGVVSAVAYWQRELGAIRR
jgi:hypothetical protein